MSCEIFYYYAERKKNRSILTNARPYHRMPQALLQWHTAYFVKKIQEEKMNGQSSTRIYLPNHQATENMGYLLGKYLPAHSTILLKGDLGTGKTTLVQGLGRGLAITESIVSPTFTLVNEYLDGRLPLYHLDLYRLPPDQITSIYPEIYWEGLEVEPGITAIEWSERLPSPPSDRLEITLTYDQKQGRQASLKLFGSNDLDLNFLTDLNQINS